MRKDEKKERRGSRGRSLNNEMYKEKKEETEKKRGSRTSKVKVVTVSSLLYYS